MTTQWSKLIELFPCVSRVWCVARFGKVTSNLDPGSGNRLYKAVNLPNESSVMVQKTEKLISVPKTIDRNLIWQIMKNLSSC